MRLSDMIQQLRMQRKAPDNSMQFSKQLDSATPPTPPTSATKSFKKSTVNALEQAQHPSPYMGSSEALTSPGPDEDNPALRDHINQYRKHATRPDMGSLNKRSYV